MKDQLYFLARQAATGMMSRREFMGRAAALGLTAAAANSLLSTEVMAAGPQKGGTIRVGLQGGSTTDSLDPALATNQVALSLIRLWGESLVELADDGGIQGKVAESYSASADARVWTFKIRQGITFSNGKPVTAEDVAQTMDRHSGEDTKSGALGIMRSITNISTEGDSVIIELDSPNADLPYLMTDYHLAIQPGGGKDDPAAAIGTGPYILKEVDMGVRFVAEKNPNSWGDLGNAETIEYVVINDNTARVAALQSGLVDMIDRVPPRTAKLVDRAPNINVHSTSGPGHYVFIMHCNTAPFDNNDVRMALKYGINRQEMVDKILLGHGAVANDIPIGPANQYFASDLPMNDYDPDMAKSLLKQAGLDGLQVDLSASDAAFSGAVDAAQLYQASAKAAGIDINVVQEPADGYWSNVWLKKPWCACYWSGR
ncbi:MAG: ABC transporter substrate-binding protein, partial [Pseudomonadota bacterium]|nr:ABC transporter substrate-binding protein [Pseudomonadota bacterium]